jgi:hypothetical protein
VPKIESKGQNASLHLGLQYKILSRLDLIGKEDIIYEQCLNHIQSGGIFSVCHILQVVSQLPSEKIQSSGSEFLLLAKSAVFDLRKNDAFWPAFEALVKVIFHPGLQSSILIENADETFQQSETIHGLALVMAHFVQDNFQLYPSDFKIHFMAALLTFGCMLKKDQVLVFKVNEYIFSQDFAVNWIEASDHLVNDKLRIIGIELLLGYKSGNLQTLVSQLKTNEQTLTKGQVRYYDNSNIHIFKQRTAQAFLIISKMKDITDEVIESMLDNALQNIEAQSQQLSVRYYYEWIVINLCQRKPKLILPKIKQRFEEVSKSRLKMVPAYLCILSHNSVQEDQDQISDMLELIAPWCLGQQFMTRLAANACFKRLFALITDEKINAKFSILDQCIDQTIHQGDKMKNEEKLYDNSFYLKEFHPEINFNLTDIYFHFPRLMGVKDVILPELFTNVQDHFCPASHQQSLLNCHRQEFCFCQDCFQTQEEEETDAFPTEILGQVQKKITPWEKMFQDTDASRWVKLRRFFKKKAIFLFF